MQFIHQSQTIIIDSWLAAATITKAIKNAVVFIAMKTANELQMSRSIGRVCPVKTLIARNGKKTGIIFYRSTSILSLENKV